MILYNTKDDGWKKQLSLYIDASPNTDIFYLNEENISNWEEWFGISLDWPIDTLLSHIAPNNTCHT